MLQKLTSSVKTRLLSRVDDPLNLPPTRIANTDKTVVIKPSSLANTLSKGSDYLKNLKKSAGYWEACVYDNATITSEFVMTMTFLDLLTPELAQKCAQGILKDQLHDGGWPIFGGGPADQSATVEAYFALKLCGVDALSAPMQRARKKRSKVAVLKPPVSLPKFI